MLRAFLIVWTVVAGLAAAGLLYIVGLRPQTTVVADRLTSQSVASQSNTAAGGSGPAPGNSVQGDVPASTGSIGTAPAKPTRTVRRVDERPDVPAAHASDPAAKPGRDGSPTAADRKPEPVAVASAPVAEPPKPAPPPRPADLSARPGTAGNDASSQGQAGSTAVPQTTAAVARTERPASDRAPQEQGRARTAEGQPDRPNPETAGTAPLTATAPLSPPLFSDPELKKVRPKPEVSEPEPKKAPPKLDVAARPTNPKETSRYELSQEAAERVRRDVANRTLKQRSRAAKAEAARLPEAAPAERALRTGRTARSTPRRAPLREARSGSLEHLLDEFSRSGADFLHERTMRVGTRYLVERTTRHGTQYFYQQSTR